MLSTVESKTERLFGRILAYCVVMLLLLAAFLGALALSPAPGKYLDCTPRAFATAHSAIVIAPSASDDFAASAFQAMMTPQLTDHSATKLKNAMRFYWSTRRWNLQVLPS